MQKDPFMDKREKMVKDQLIKRGIHDNRVLEVMRKIPRHLFVPENLVDEAYNDYPLPIGYGQTISQPYMVAIMTEALELKGDEKTLEIGTGSGYQTAILAELSKEVYTIERIIELLDRAKNIIAQLGCKNVFFKAGDGTLGWPEYQPFDAIIVAAGSPNIPKPLIEQLADEGRLVIPVGNKYSQDLIKVTKRGDELLKENMGGCRFVDLIGIYGWKE